PLLAEFFLRKNIRNFRGLSPQIKSALVDYDWPGNVRELQNVCERIAILGEKALSLSNIIDYVDDQSIKIEIETVSGEQMAPPSILEASSHSSDLTLPIKLGMPLDEVERILILATLKYTGNNQKKAAEILGVSSRTLRNKLSEYRKKSLINDINFNSR
ncbi:MAG: DUF134 domain-containing protein, partial [Deltaproteobacteria bacterium]|nr:DUF134 domain-containing protein [Deltaproteobacteria bacterium]